MKKLLFPAAVILLLAASCAQNKETREELKAEHSVEHKRNAGVDSTLIPKTDSTTVAPN